MTEFPAASTSGSPILNSAAANRSAVFASPHQVPPHVRSYDGWRWQQMLASCSRADLDDLVRTWLDNFVVLYAMGFKAMEAVFHHRPHLKAHFKFKNDARWQSEEKAKRVILALEQVLVSAVAVLAEEKPEDGCREMEKLLRKMQQLGGFHRARIPQMSPDSFDLLFRLLPEVIVDTISARHPDGPFPLDRRSRLVSAWMAVCSLLSRHMTMGWERFVRAPPSPSSPPSIPSSSSSASRSREDEDGGPSACSNSSNSGNGGGEGDGDGGGTTGSCLGGRPAQPIQTKAPTRAKSPALVDNNKSLSAPYMRYVAGSSSHVPQSPPSSMARLPVSSSQTAQSPPADSLSVERRKSQSSPSFLNALQRLRGVSLGRSKGHATAAAAAAASNLTPSSQNGPRASAEWPQFATLDEHMDACSLQDVAIHVKHQDRADDTAV